MVRGAALCARSEFACARYLCFVFASMPVFFDCCRRSPRLGSGAARRLPIGLICGGGRSLPHSRRCHCAPSRVLALIGCAKTASQAERIAAEMFKDETWHGHRPSFDRAWLDRVVARHPELGLAFGPTPVKRDTGEQAIYVLEHLKTHFDTVDMLFRIYSVKSLAQVSCIVVRCWIFFFFFVLMSTRRASLRSCPAATRRPSRVRTLK